MTILIGQTWSRDGQPIDLTCDHRPHWVAYNAAACRYMETEAIRLAYPRFEGQCLTCRQRCVLYASLDHAIAGGWL